MFPLPLAGLTAAGVTLISKYKTKSITDRQKYKLKTAQTNSYRLKGRLNSLNNPVLSIIKNLRTNVKEIFRKPTKVDYDTIVSTFLPIGAQIMVPKFPMGSGRYLIVDLDNDSTDEIITSYKHGDEIKTMILKKQNGDWYKASEVIHTGYSNFHYRNIVSLSDENKKQLLIGVLENGKVPNLFGYELTNNYLNTLFNHHYQRLELLQNKNVSNGNVKQELALWEKDSTDLDTYNIDVLSLKDNQLNTCDNLASYYSKKVIPYYARIIKKSPNNTANWYNLAKAFVRAKSYNDAQVAINIGSSLDTNSIYKRSFEDLRNSMDNLNN